MEALRSTLPLSMDVLRRVITQPETEVVVDYDGGVVKGRAALVYLSNLNLQNFRIESSDRQAASELIDAYVTHKSTLNVPVLVNSLILLLLYLNEIPIGEEERASLMAESLLKADEDIEYYCISPERVSHLARLTVLLDNIPTFVYSCSKAIDIASIPAEQSVDDIDFTGTTFVHLLTNDLFVTLYYRKQIDTPPIYFKQQFNEPIYAGRNLFAHLASSLIFTLVWTIQSGRYKLEDLNQLAAANFT